jgi:enoyl-CoA hydratase
VSDLLRLDLDGRAALLTLNRPEKRNALSIELRFALAEALARLTDDAEVAAIGLTGAGSAFCSGMDTTQFGGDERHREQLFESSVRCFEALARCPKPTVALVNGPALAGGFALALLCDVRVAAPTARFGFPELGRHIPPAFAAASAALPPALARELCLTGRVLDAQEALALGVVSRISAGRETLDAIAAAPPAATVEVKRRILLQAEGAGWAALMAEEERVLRHALLPSPGE